MTALTPEQVSVLLAAARGDRIEALYVVAVTTRMRHGELLALQWSDLDLEARTVRIRATLLKTKSGFEFAEPKKRTVAPTDFAHVDSGRCPSPPPRRAT